MDGTEFLPVVAEPCQRIPLTDASHLVLICYDIDRKSRNLLLVARILEVRIEYSVRRDHYLLSRSEFAGLGSEEIGRLDGIICQHRAEAVLDRKIPAVHRRMVAVKSGKFCHHLYLTRLGLGVAEVIVLIHSPSGAHEHLHSMLCRSIHHRIHRALPPLGIMPVHQLGRVISLPFVGHRHEDEILHAHLLHLRNLGLPHLRVGVVDVRRVGVEVAHILIRKIDESTLDRKHLRRAGLHHHAVLPCRHIVFRSLAACKKRRCQRQNINDFHKVDKFSSKLNLSTE